MKPTMNVVKIQQLASILSASDNSDMNKSLQDEEVEEALSRRRGIWNDDEKEEW